MNKTFSSMVAAATLLMASHASAATIDFSTAGTGAAGATGLAGISYTTSSTYGTTPFPTASTVGTVGASAYGLGSGGDGQFSDFRIDGITRGTWEVLTVNFSAAVNLADFILGRMDTNDDFELSINGGTFAAYAAPVSVGGNQLVTFAGIWADVTSFSIRASGTAADGNNTGTTGDDDFTLFAANVTSIAPVPLPAGAPLLLAGLAGLAALRRRKRA